MLVGACTGGTDEETLSQNGFMADSSEVVARSTVVEEGTDGYDIFRIPVLVRAPNGDLLLFCEGRVTGSDFGNIDVLLFRSTDAGATWSEGTVVAENGSNTASDMAAVVQDGRVHLLFQKRPGDRTFSDYQNGDATDARGYHMYSDDSGRTWSEPRDITNQVLPASDEQLPMFGPNNGIVLNSGRLVVPMYYANQSANDWTPSVIYSDDGGETWRRSVDATPGQGVNETAVVQAANGDVYGVARDGSRDENDQKRFFRSTDGGETWTEIGDVHPFVPEVSCQQSMVARGNRLFLATPAQGSRRDGRLKTGTYEVGQPDNVRWEEDDLQLTPDGFAYSTMALQDSLLHIVYEEKTPDQYAALQYVRVRLD
jgi:sialidase-1